MWEKTMTLLTEHKIVIHDKICPKCESEIYLFKYNSKTKIGKFKCKCGESFVKTKIKSFIPKSFIPKVYIE